MSTWIGYEVGLFDDLLSHLPDDGAFPTNGYGLFLAALPYRFYCFYALMLVFIIAFTGRDFGPMLTAEARTRATGLVKNDENEDKTPSSSLEKPGVPLRALNAVVPILTVLVSILCFVLSAAPEQTGSLMSLDGLRNAFGNSDLDLAHILFKSALLGAGICIVLASVQRLLTPKEITNAFVDGMSGLWGAACVLILAWAIKQVCDDLGTGTVILALMGDQITPEFVPVIIFLFIWTYRFFHGHVVGHNGSDAADCGPSFCGDFWRSSHCPRFSSCGPGWRDLGRPLFANFRYHRFIIGRVRLSSLGSREDSGALRHIGDGRGLRIGLHLC